jgi:hypothetical protein
VSVGILRPWLGWALAGYDTVYRARHHLDTPESEIGSCLRIELRPSPWTFRFADGTLVARGDQIGVLHLNNDAVVALHADGLSPMAIGLHFRRNIFLSLRILAQRFRHDQRFGDVHALSATTILHTHMRRRLGFEVEPGALLSPRLVALYQRTLLTWLHPAGRLRLRGCDFGTAARLWLSRSALLARYGGEADETRDGREAAA